VNCACEALWNGVEWLIEGDLGGGGGGSGGTGCRKRSCYVQRWKTLKKFGESGDFGVKPQRACAKLVPCRLLFEKPARDPLLPKNLETAIETLKQTYLRPENEVKSHASVLLVFMYSHKYRSL
jgi:hypothetical protein